MTPTPRAGSSVVRGRKLTRCELPDPIPFLPSNWMLVPRTVGDRVRSVRKMDYEVLDVDSQHPKVEQHLLRVAEGVYGLPEFQRTFVWDHDRIRGLWASLSRGFPAR